MSGTVCALKVQSYSYEQVQAAVDRQFEMLELDQLISPGMKVVIKPNLLMKRTPEEATTTHPALVAAIAQHLLKLGAGSVMVAESPGGLYNKSQLTGIYQATGMTAYGERYGFSLNEDLAIQRFRFLKVRTARLSTSSRRWWRQIW